MIKVKFEDGKMEAEGHALMAPAGSDIVCSAFSMLVFTLVNGLGNDMTDMDLDNGSCRITWKENKTTHIVAKTIKGGIQLLANKYPENVKMF